MVPKVTTIWFIVKRLWDPLSETVAGVGMAKPLVVPEL